MRIFRILILLMIFPLVSAFSAHKFYVSLTKIEYVQKKESLQIITKIFIDDVEDALQKRYDPTISLDSKKETPADVAFLKKYILQKLHVKVNGKDVKLEYLGQEYETDMVVAYLEVKGITDIESLEIENTVLMDMFSDQQNIIHLKTTKSRRSLILDRDEPKGILNF